MVDSQLLIHSSHDPIEGRASILGGKATNLALLEAAGQRVPPWYAVTTEALHAAHERAGLTERVAARLKKITAAPGAPADMLASASSEIRKWICDSPVPPQLLDAIERVHAACFPHNPFVAVRSSAVGEDEAGASFAGLHDSFVFVRGREEIIEAIRKVWASAYNERALSYRLEKDIPLSGIAIAVVVQEMVSAHTSGVMFTVNPVTGDVNEIVISALFGAGEGIVSAGLSADTYTVAKRDLSVCSERAPKEERFVLDDSTGRGLRREPLPESLLDTSSLSDDQVRSVASAGLAIEEYYGRPQDVEFSFDGDGNLYILQSRPVTTVEEYGPAAGNRLTWDNSNIIESYSGVTSPLTFSVIRHAYEIVYHCFADVMGIPPRIVRENKDTFANMLGLIRGRVYYNLINWYRLLHLFPGFNYNKQFMESMMGLKEPVEFKDDEAPGLARRYFVELPRLLRLLFRSMSNFVRIRTIVVRFERHFEDHVSRWRAMDLRALAPHKLMALYEEMEETILWNWKAPIINDFYVMVYYGTLKKLCASWCGDTTESLQNDLLCGEGDIESTKPTKMLLDLAKKANQNPELRDLFLTQAPDVLAREIPADARFGEFNTLLADYLEIYGFRCMNELKLEEYSLRDRPEFVYQMIKNYLALDDPTALDVAAMEERERQVRSEAEKRAYSAMRFPPCKRPIFRGILRNARLGVKNRENMRFARARIYDLLRDIFRSVGHGLAHEGILDGVDDVVFLTVDELWDYIKGTAVTTNLRKLVALRRSEFEGYRQEEEAAPDDRFDTFGPVYHRNLFKDRRQVPAASEEGMLQGTGCCPGEVTGPVKVIRSPSDDMSLSGEILVAGRTDPGWVPLYPSVSGILIERGSILSHSAIVAREMGIPTIVGIPGLLDSLATGQWVRMDGSAGTVSVTEEPSDGDSGQ